MELMSIRSIDNAISFDLHEIFKGVNLMDYDVVIEDGFYTYGGDENLLPSNAEMKGVDFQNLIAESHNRYYMVFCDLYLYPKDASIQTMDTFADYLNSDCRAIINCIDVGDLYVVTKDKDIQEKIYNDFKASHDIEYIRFREVDPNEAI